MLFPLLFATAYCLPVVLQQEILVQVDREADIEVAVRIETLEGELIADFHGDRKLVLASNTKLLTTAAALTALGADYRWTTRVFLEEDALWIQGNGDPSFRETPQGNPGEDFLDALAKSLRENEKEKVGELWVDGRAFPGPVRPLLWPGGTQEFSVFCAPVSACSVEGNCVLAKVARRSVKIFPTLSPPIQVPFTSRAAKTSLSMWWTGGKVDHTLQFGGGTSREQELRLAVGHPLEVFGRWVKSGLQTRGLLVGRVRVAQGDSPHPSSTPLLIHPSAWTVADVVQLANKESDNFMAEVLFQTIGYEKGTPPLMRAPEALQASFEELGLLPAAYSQIDGSGLSRRWSQPVNQSTPEDLCALLRKMAESEEALIYFHSLPVGGKDGSLKNRFTEPLFQPNRVRAKTGWIVGASALSGYLLAGETPLVFSILINYTKDKTSRTNNARFKKMQEDYLHEVLRKWTIH